MRSPTSAVWPEGKKQAEESILKAQETALAAVEKEIAAIKATIDENETKAIMDIVDVSSAIFKKLMPELERKGGFDEIKAILEQNFSKLAKEPRLRLFINPAHIPELKEKLTAIAKKAGFLGKIVIEGKEELKLSDIKVEWDSGGIERDSSALSAEIDDILALYSKKG